MQRLTLVLILLITVCVLTGIMFPYPSPVYAGPLAGFTPTPTTPDEPDDGGQGPETRTDDSEKDKVPANFIVVQLETCDLSCSIAAPTQQGVAPAVLARVQLIHQGSGWIAENTLSSQTSTRMPVPYPGRWDVYLIDRPQVEPAAFFETGLTTALDQPSQEQPTWLGLVEANSATPQLVACPLNCNIDPPTPAEVPDFLPETGGPVAAEMSLAVGALICGLAVLIVGLTLFIIIRLGPVSPSEKDRF